MPLPHPATSSHASRPALGATTSHNAQPPAAGSQSRVKRLSSATAVAGPGLVNLPAPIGPPPNRQRVVRPVKSMPSLRSAAAAAAASLAAGPVPLLPRNDAFTPADILNDDLSSSNEIESGQVLSPAKKIFAKEIFVHKHEREFPHLHGGSDEGGAPPSRRQSLVLPTAKTDSSSLLATSLPPPFPTVASQVTPSPPSKEAATRRMPRPLSLVALQPSGGLFAASIGEAAVILLDHEQLQQPQDLCRTTELTGERIVDPREASRTSLIESVSEDGSSECDFLFSWERAADPAVDCHAQPLPPPPFSGPTLLLTPPPISDVKLPSSSAFVTPPLPSCSGGEDCSLPPTPISVFSSPSTSPAIASSPSSSASPSMSALRRASAAHARKPSISYHHSGAADSPRTDSHAALSSSTGSPPQSASTRPVARRQPSISYRGPMSSPLDVTANKEDGQGRAEDVGELEEQSMRRSLSEGVVGLGLRGRYIWDGGMEPAPASPPPPTPTSPTFSIEQQQQQQQPASRSSWRTWFGGASSSTPYLVSPTSSSFHAPPSLSAAHASDDLYGAWTDPGDHLERGEGGRRPSHSGSTISTLAGSLVRGWRPWITSPRPSSPTSVTTAPVAALTSSTSDSSFGNAPGDHVWHPAAGPSSPLLPPPSPNNSGYPFPIPSSAGSTSTFGGPLRLPPPAMIAGAPSNNRERRGSVSSSLTPSQDDEPVDRSYHSTFIAPPPRGLRPLVLAPPPAIARLQQPLKSLGASARLTLLPMIKGSPSKIELEEGRRGAAEDNEEEQEGTRTETSPSPTKQQPPAVAPHCHSALLDSVSASVVSNQQHLQLHATFVDPPAEAFADRLRSHRRSGSVLKHRVGGSVLGEGQPAFGSTALSSVDEQLQRRKASRGSNEKTYSTSISHHPATSTTAFHVERFAHSHGSPSSISTASSLQPTTLAPTTPTLTFNDESTTTRRSDDSFSRDQQPDPTTPVTQRPLSLYETLEQFVSSPLAWLEALLPAQLVFFLGFLLGPWCWVIGGWGLSTDGRVILTKLQGAQLPSAFLGGAALSRLSSADSSPELRWRPTSSSRQARPPTMTSWSPSASVDANGRFQQPFFRGRGGHPRPDERGKGSRWALPALRSDNPNRWVWRNRIAAMLSGAVVIPGMTLAVIFAAI